MRRQKNPEKWQKEADHERTSENGTFGNETVYGDLSNGCLSVGTFSSQVPEDIQKQYLKIVDQIKDGSFVEE